MKKTSLLLFAVITALFSNSCVKEETETSNFTGFYNSKSVYNNDLLLRTVSSAVTSSFFGTGSGTDLNINANLFVSKSTGLKTVTRINKTLDSIHVYELDKPELGGLLYIIKNNILSVHQFEFVGINNKINATFHYASLPIPAGRYASSRTNENDTESIIDKAIERFYNFTQTLGSSEVLESIKESASNAKDNAIKSWENTQQSRDELSAYLNKLVGKNPEPIKVPLEEDPINQDEQKIINNLIKEPFDCNTSTLAMTISDPYISNGVASVRANGIGGDGNYSYKWSDGQVGDYAVFSKSGTYTVTVTDGNGCSLSSSVLIKLDYDCTNTTLTSTVEVNNDNAFANVSGGITPYKFLWSNGAVSQSVSKLPEGIYELKVTDAVGCEEVNSFSIAIDSSAIYMASAVGKYLKTPADPIGSTTYCELFANGKVEYTVYNNASWKDGTIFNATGGIEKHNGKYFYSETGFWHPGYPSIEIDSPLKYPVNSFKYHNGTTYTKQ